MKKEKNIVMILSDFQLDIELNFDKLIKSKFGYINICTSKHDEV